MGVLMNCCTSEDKDFHKYKAELKTLHNFKEFISWNRRLKQELEVERQFFESLREMTKDDKEMLDIIKVHIANFTELDDILKTKESTTQQVEIEVIRENYQNILAIILDINKHRELIIKQPPIQEIKYNQCVGNLKNLYSRL